MWRETSAKSGRNTREELIHEKGKYFSFKHELEKYDKEATI